MAVKKCKTCGKEFRTTRNTYCSKECMFIARRKFLPKDNMQNNYISNDYKLYKKWWHIQSRCNNPKDISYKNYGGRGIKVCNEWNSFVAFKDWCYKNNYNSDLEIDRIDVNGNYEPNNCRFVSKLENTRNRRITKKYEYNGEIKSLGEIAQLLGIKYKILWQRINRAEKKLLLYKYEGFEFREIK